jgi:hypothetical protein
MQPLPLADEIFLIGHDQYSGKPHVNDSTLDTGLAGAVMAELVLMGRVHVNEETAVIVTDVRPFGERVSDAALAELLKQREHHPVRAWVEYLRDHVRTMVAPRVVHGGLVQRVQSRSMLKQVVRYPATDPHRAAAPGARLRYMVDHPNNLDVQTATLGGLVLAMGLDFVLGGVSPRETRDALSRMQMLLHPDLKALIVGVESAVAALALSGRR